MLSMCAIVPHPPVSISEIARGDEWEKMQNTIRGFDFLRKEIEKRKLETVVFISPHAKLEPHAFVINSEISLKGNFIDFGWDNVLEFKNDLDLANKIVLAGEYVQIPIHLHGSFLEHGVLVPAYHLFKNIKPKIIHLSFSLLSYQDHFKFGQLLRRLFEMEKNKKIGLIASGELSHRLGEDSPAGYSPQGVIFDEWLLDNLQKKDMEKILNPDQNLVNNAGECGLRSIIVALGVMQGEYEFKKISYEHPFGVGYLIAQLLDASLK